MKLDGLGPPLLSSSQRLRLVDSSPGGVTMTSDADADTVCSAGGLDCLADCCVGWRVTTDGGWLGARAGS